METIAIRLRPGQDPKAELEALAAERGWEAACVLTCVGSLTRAVLRFANRNEPTVLEGHFEIVALTATLSRHGAHMHIAIADPDGRTYGAHLLDGSRIYTTAEIVLGILPDVSFGRELDPQTGYPELDIRPLTG
jgi:uncharacterized protein